MNYVLIFCLKWFGSEWQIGTGESAGFKSLTAFYPKEESNSNGIIKLASLCSSTVANCNVSI
jgi:hypothetical protein